jgi:hypothetical protein
MTGLSDEDMLNLAKGISSQDMSSEAQEAAALITAKQVWLTVPTSGRDILLHRKKIRKTLFKILKYVRLERLDDLTIEQRALQEIINDQLDPNLGIVWAGFTFIWDIHPKEPPTVIRKEAWSKSGGGYDELDQCFPSAFTKQGM